MEEDLVGFLPIELINEIFSYLSADELFSARQVNRRWKCLIMTNNYLWKNICIQYDILNYTPTIQYETPFIDSSDYAIKYLAYEKILKTNWTTAKSHLLHELSAPTVENIVLWKRTFVRTYNNGNVIDIFKVDSQCKVHRLQRICTRYTLTGSDHITINDTWLGIIRWNAASVYKIQSDGLYKLIWIFIFVGDEISPIRFIHVKDNMNFEVIDHFLEEYHSYTGTISLKYISKQYIWLAAWEYLVLNVDEHNGQAAIIRRLQSDSDEFCFDRRGIAAHTLNGVGFYKPTGECTFFYNLTYKPLVLNAASLNCLQQNRVYVAFIENLERCSVVVINRLTYSILKICDTNPTIICLHPSKFLIFILFKNTSTVQTRLALQTPWKLSCYSTVNGNVVWNIEKYFKGVPNTTSFKVINNNFLLMSPLLRGSQKYTLYNCDTGKILSITEEESLPVSISDVFKVCQFISRSITIGVKCYL